MYLCITLLELHEMMIFQVFFVKCNVDGCYKMIIAVENKMRVNPDWPVYVCREVLRTASVWQRMYSCACNK